MTNQKIGPMIPDLTEPILAYRHWSISGADLAPPMHRANGNGQVWVPGKCVAKCERYKRDDSTNCQEIICACGFYGVWSLAHEYALVQTNYSAQKIFGIIECYGRVRLGTHGLRASKARVLALHLPPITHHQDNYQISRSDIHKLMEKFGLEGTKFYKDRSNLINAFEVKRPDTVIFSPNYG